jgi:hypothetical protein
MNDFILINSFDISALCAALVIAGISRTKAAAITAAEFALFAFFMNVVLLMEWSSPLVWLIFTAICYFACYFHIICTSHPAIITSFFIPMVYNLAMFSDWSLAQWAGFSYGIFDHYYTPAMTVIVIFQLALTGMYGGLRSGFIDIWHNIFNSNNSDFRVMGSASE